MDGLGVCGGNLTVFPARVTLDFPLPPVGVIAAGVTLGEVRKGRIVPHHIPRFDGGFFAFLPEDPISSLRISVSDKHHNSPAQ